MYENFKSELELVETFIRQNNDNEREILVQELPIRFGNIDIVRIKNSNLPFTKKQIEVLSKPSNSLVFTKIKNSRPISKTKLEKNIGLSVFTVKQSISELLNAELIEKNSNSCFLRKAKFVFPKTTVIGYEAKLSDFNKAFYQANGNKDYVDYSYLVFPLDVARKLLLKKKHILENNGIGLIGVSLSKTIILCKATKTLQMKNNIRLLSLAKANKIVNESKCMS